LATQLAASADPTWTACRLVPLIDYLSAMMQIMMSLCWPWAEKRWADDRLTTGLIDQAVEEGMLLSHALTGSMERRD
jgi:hypothetical protein